MKPSSASDAAGPPLEASAVNLWRGEQHLLRNVSFELRRGELLQVVGPNGIGKSSLLRVVAGLLPAESGQVCWMGADTWRDSENYGAALSYLGHANALKQDLTALENLYFAVRLRRDVNVDQCMAVLRALGVEHCASLPVRVLSAGQRRRVALARVRLSRTSFWILDEPLTNLDADGVQAVEALMAMHLAEGGLILAAAHQSLLAGDERVRSLALN